MWHALRRLLGLALLTLPLLAAYQRTRERAGRAAEALGHALGSLNRPQPLHLERPPPAADAGVAIDPAELDLPAAPTVAGPRKVARRWPQGMRSILISDRRVLELAQAGAVPQGTKVAKSGSRPAGLQLSGVSQLGVGVQDGDVLFEVAGVPVKSETQVAEIVRVVRDQRAHSVGARLWRSGETIALVVGMPY